jgi:hypothetical protein
MKEEYTDGAQGIAIIAIVSATVLGRIDDAGFLQDGRVAHLLVLIQYAVCTFGYPCLFFLLGLKAMDLLRRANSRWGFVKMTLGALVYPYLLWSLLQMGVQWLVAQHAHHPFSLEEFDRAAWAPVDQLWFLYALCICQIVAYVSLWKAQGARRGMVSGVSRVLLAVLAVICATLATRTDWGIVTMTLWGLTFFLAGMLLGPRCSVWMGRTPRILALIIAVVVFAVTIRVGQSLGGYLNASALPASFAGIVTTLLIAKQLSSRWRANWLTTLGAAWMPVYLLHVLVTGLVWSGLLTAYVTSPVAHFFLGVAAGLIVPVVVYRLTRRLRLAGLAGFGLVDLAERTEARQMELERYRARIGVDQPLG